MWVESWSGGSVSRKGGCPVGWGGDRAPRPPCGSHDTVPPLLPVFGFLVVDVRSIGPVGRKAGLSSRGSACDVDGATVRGHRRRRVAPPRSVP